MIGTAFKKIFKKQNDNPTDEISILYGSHSGNSEFIAKEAKNYLKTNGLSVIVYNLAKYDFRKLANEKTVLIIISTHGEGDPPDSAQKFYNHLFSEDAPSLSNLQFAVCALGDSSYELFCKTGKDIDFRLEELGGRRFHQRVDCDLEFHQPASQWVSEVLQKSKSTENTVAPIQVNTKKLHPFYVATVSEKRRLNEGSSSETYHVVLEVEADFHYHTGDSVGIVPQNDEKLVDQILKQLGFSGETTVWYNEETVLLKKLLIEEFELTSCSKKLLENYQRITQDEKLKELLSDEKKSADYLNYHDVLDLIIDFPFSESSEDFVAVLRKIQPRYYSISSSQKKHPEEVHLIVKLVKSEQKNRMRFGACSSFLNHWIEVGQRINLQLIPNEQFRMPSGDIPMIMIAAGTGIAPFRAFLEEQEINNSPGKNWLFFGEKYQQYDFYYGDDWKYWLKNKQLERMDIAFSCEHNEKIYVQHKILEKGSEFYKWLIQGTHVYICGSVAMGHDVKKAICQVIQMGKRTSEQNALHHWEKMTNENRIHLDVY